MTQCRLSTREAISITNKTRMRKKLCGIMSKPYHIGDTESTLSKIDFDLYMILKYLNGSESYESFFCTFIIVLLVDK